MDRRAGPKVAAFAEAAKRWDLACATWGCEGRVEIDLFVGVADPELAEEMVDVVEARGSNEAVELGAGLWAAWSVESDGSAL